MKAFEVLINLKDWSSVCGDYKLNEEERRVCIEVLEDYVNKNKEQNNED